MIAEKFPACRPAHGTGFPKCQVADTPRFDSQISSALSKQARVLFISKTSDRKGNTFWKDLATMRQRENGATLLELVLHNICRRI